METSTSRLAQTSFFSSIPCKKTKEWIFSKVLFLLTAVLALSSLQVYAADLFEIEKALICEEISNRNPSKKAVVFKNGIEKIYCYTLLDKVKDNSVIYHNWYKRDNLSSRIKLSVKPPKWATYSSIQLRDYDNGPWKVDITDSEGNILKTLRFSILD